MGGIAPAAIVCGFLISVVIVALSLHYAKRRGLLDQPGFRRSHTRATPRGGGIGIVIAVLICASPLLSIASPSRPVGTIAVMGVALLMVAAVGWLDDHAPLPIVPRIAVHVLASLAVAAVLLAPFAHTQPLAWWWLLIAVPVIAGCINAHNFMDGIDGLLGLQALFVFCGYALLARSIGQDALSAASLAVAAACCGFLVFNLPPARIFMGDVGSGAIGLLIAVFAGLLIQRTPWLAWPCVILSSAFIVDAGLTLLQRMLLGRRWYTAHREHLYQWMVRADLSHARTDGFYMLWNLIIVAPAAWAATRWPQYGMLPCVAVYALSCTVWFAGKRACLASARRSACDVA